MTPGKIVIDVPELRLDPERMQKAVDWAEVFGTSDDWSPDGPIEIEIGIGKGRFLLAAAEGRPHVRHLGVEWANKYLRFAEVRSVRRGLKNVRFVRMDVWHLMGAIPDASVTAYYVFYPDPWPKRRHHKRRFLQRTNADQIARTLVPGGHLHVATDHDGYWSAIEPVFNQHPAFERLPAFGGPTFPIPSDGPLTNFEIKYEVEGRNRHRATWQRRP